MISSLFLSWLHISNTEIGLWRIAGLPCIRSTQQFVLCLHNLKNLEHSVLRSWKWMKSACDSVSVSYSSLIRTLVKTMYRGQSSHNVNRYMDKETNMGRHGHGGQPGSYTCITMQRPPTLHKQEHHTHDTQSYIDCFTYHLTKAEVVSPPRGVDRCSQLCMFVSTRWRCRQRPIIDRVL